MILAIDIGNTNIVVGCIDENEIYFTERLSTVRTKTELEYAVDLKTILDIYHIKKTEIEGCIISSVVPQITNIAKLAVEKILKKKVMVLGPGIKTGLNILMDNPGQLGADLVADAVAASNNYPAPLIVIDMGTATTVSVLNDKKQYIGGMILPGVGLSLDALTHSIPPTTSRAANSMPAITSSFTPLALAPGVLNTTIPFWAHLSRGMLLTPAPALATASRFSGRSISCMEALRTRTPSASFILSVTL